MLVATMFCSLAAAARADDPWVVYEGGKGPGHGKHVVLIAGDEEYRSEEGLPMLGKILARHHGFKCTVLFSVDPKDGKINPNQSDNIPGLEALDTADLVVMLIRFRKLPDDQMRHFAEYVDAGKPIVGLRTATHAFNNKEGSFAKYDWQNTEWDGGFGRQVLGETWISHHGKHGSQSTRGVIAPGAEKHPILRGIRDGDIWGPTDVYGVRLPLPGDSQPLVLGQVLSGMQPNDAPVDGDQNKPMMPVAWIKSYESPAGKTGRAFATTMGASQDLSSEGLRRLVVNACYWAIGLEDKIPPASNVDIVGVYAPTPFGFGKFTAGLRPSDHELKSGKR